MKITDTIGGLFDADETLAEKSAKEAVEYYFNGRVVEIIESRHAIDKKTGNAKRSYEVTLSYVLPQDKELNILAKKPEEAMKKAEETINFCFGGQVIEYKSVELLENKNNIGKYRVVVSYILPDEISMENEEEKTKKLTINN